MINNYNFDNIKKILSNALIVIGNPAYKKCYYNTLYILTKEIGDNSPLNFHDLYFKGFVIIVILP
jgi:hypothetical protein